MSKLKAGIIGCGEYGWLHAKVIHNLGLFDLCAFINRREEKAKTLCAEFGIAGAYTGSDYKAAVADPQIGVIYVCTTHDAHYPIAMDALRQGKHIFMEKPLAMTLGQCSEIEAVAKKAEGKFFIGHKMRFMPMVVKARREMPKPVSIIAQMMCDRWPDDFWAQDPVKGGGNVLSQGCHIFDLVTHLAGAKPETLYAEGGAFTHPGSSQIDNIVATVRYKNGVIASITIGDAGNNDFTSKTMIQMYGGDDCINLSNRLRDYARYRGQSVETEIWPAEHGDAWDELDPEGICAENRAFYDCIINGKEPPVSAKQGADAVRMVFAAFKSIKEKAVQKW